MVNGTLLDVLNQLEVIRLFLNTPELSIFPSLELKFSQLNALEMDVEDYHQVLDLERCQTCQWALEDQ
jgi:hypothetical protein